MVLLKELVAVVPREETGGLASKTGKARDAEATEREGKRARFATTQISQSFVFFRARFWCCQCEGRRGTQATPRVRLLWTTGGFAACWLCRM